MVLNTGIGLQKSAITTQGRLHCTQYFAECRFTPSHSSLSDQDISPRTWVSTKAGSTPTCHCRSPYFLNSQHQPPTGRRKPAPGTSSMCPQRIFRPVFKVNFHWL